MKKPITKAKEEKPDNYQKPLTKEQIDYWYGTNKGRYAFARAIEAAHGIK